MHTAVLKKFSLAGHEVALYREAEARALLLQPVDVREKTLAEEIAGIRAAGVPFALAAFSVRDWNTELAPWDAPAVFGRADFGHGAAATLAFVQQELLPKIREKQELASLPVILGGYSLAALFSLWAATQTDTFAAVAAASPSVWYPGWLVYARAHQPQSAKIYLSLGDREAHTKNPVLATVADCIRKQCAAYCAQLGEENVTLVWNRGSHFEQVPTRTAAAFVWCLQELQGE